MGQLAHIVDSLHLAPARLLKKESEEVIMEETGTCKHGTFPLREGCPQCIAERAAAQKEGVPVENLSEITTKEEAEEVGSKMLEQVAGEEKIEAVQPKTNIVKVQYYSEGKFSSREYTYYSVDRLAVGDRIIVPVRDSTVKAMVSAIDVPESEIASFKDKVKTIPGGIKETAEDAEVNSPENIRKRVEAVQPKEALSLTYICPNDCEFQLVSDDCTGHPFVEGLWYKL